MIDEIINRGYKNIVFCHDRESLIRNQRVQAAQSACEARGYKNLLLEGSKYCSIEEGKRIVKKVVSQKLEKPCIMFTDDYVALGGWQAIRELNIKVPDDMAIVGFDGIQIGQILYPKLTTVRQDSKKIGETVAQKMLRLISDPNEQNEVITLPTELLFGDTL